MLIKSFLGGDTERAASIGITFGLSQKYAAATSRSPCWPARRRSTGSVCGFPLVSERLDQRLNRRLAALLDMYGHADFVTDADQYNLSAQN